MLTLKDKDKIISNTIESVHNLIRKKKNIDSRYKYDWKKKESNYYSIIMLFSMLMITIYLNIYNKEISIISNSLFIILIYIIYLEGGININLNSLPNEYKLELNNSLHKLLDGIVAINNESKDIDNSLSSSKSRSILDSKLKDCKLKKYIVDDKSIIDCLLNNIDLVNDTYLNRKINENNCDILIKNNGKEIPDIEYNKENIVVELEIDNGIFCLGDIEEDSKIVKLILDNNEIKIKDSCNLKILIV